MTNGAAVFGRAIACLAALLAARAHAEDIDTEHIFGFMIGADVGTKGEREFQSQTSAALGKSGGRYRAVGQELELEVVPADNFRIEVGAAVAAHDIRGVPGLDDRRQLTLQGGSIDLRYKFLDRHAAPFGVTAAIQSFADRVDETTGEKVNSRGAELTLALDRDLIPDVVVGGINLIYQPEWTRTIDTDVAERQSTAGTAVGVMAQVYPGVLLGGEARYLRRYDVLGLDRLAGQALFIGPTAYIQLSTLSRLTVSWSSQAWRHEAGSNSALDLTNFERHQARVVFGINF